MERHSDHLRALRKKKRIRHWLMASVILLVFLGGIAAGLLLHQGLANQETAEDAQSVLQHQTQPNVPETDPPAHPTQTTAPTTTEPAEETVPATLPPQVDAVQAVMDTMTLKEKICQLFMVSPEALTDTEVITTAQMTLADDLAEYPVGGIILFRQNLVDRQQCQTLIADYQSLSRIPLLVGVDEEGGTVSRLGNNSAMGVTRFPSMAEIGASGDKTAAYQVGYTLGTELAELGFNLDFAPVADVNTNPNNPVIGERAFSSDPATAAKMVAACVRGFEAANMPSTLKHFPGHGDTSTDSHLGYASSEQTLDELRETEFLPFLAGLEAGSPIVMMGHISLPNVTGDGTPASLSAKVVTDILRTELGFAGVIITDAMNMGAVTEHYTPGEAATAAIIAGCDLILMPEDLPQAIAAIEEAIESGTITTARIDESVRRIIAMKLEYGILGDEFQ